MKKMGLDDDDIKSELKARQTVLEWLMKQGIRHHSEVARVIREYYTNPNRVYQKARVGLK